MGEWLEKLVIYWTDGEITKNKHTSKWSGVKKDGETVWQ